MFLCQNKKITNWWSGFGVFYGEEDFFGFAVFFYDGFGYEGQGNDFVFIIQAHDADALGGAAEGWDIFQAQADGLALGGNDD